MQDGRKVYMDFYHGIGWIMFHGNLDLLEVGITQNWETMALQTLTTVNLFYFIMCEDPRD